MHIRMTSVLATMLLVLAACQGPLGREIKRGTAAGAVARNTQTQRLASLEPHVRPVPAADHAMLWEAARGYMGKAFPVDTEDEANRVVESKELEWMEHGRPHRTRVTVQVIADPRDARNAQVGVIAQLIEPVYLLEEAATGRPLYEEWELLGNNERIEQVVADQIMRRYLLLREGRNPDEVPQADPFGPFALPGRPLDPRRS